MTTEQLNRANDLMRMITPLKWVTGENVLREDLNTAINLLFAIDNEGVKKFFQSYLDRFEKELEEL